MTTNSIFQTPWWLDAVSPDRWEAIELSTDGKVVARLPYVMQEKMGLKLLTMPKLTQSLGPWIAPSTAKYTKQLSQQKTTFSDLIDRLPPHDYFSQNFHYSIAYWLPFLWRGFTIRPRCTYAIEDLTNIDLVWSGFQENIRREIRKAQKAVAVRSDLGIDKFLDINELTFERQGKKLPYSREYVQRIDDACVEHQASKIFFAEDPQGRIHAAIYIIWDRDSAYYLMGGGDPELRTSGATSLLMWEAIQFAATVTKKFDFEGSQIEPVERFFRAFGGTQLTYFNISRSSSRKMKVLATGRDIIKSIIPASYDLEI
jgi:lipid II:glycine glycyltransferase (peptidoglycan interpeptide bridge formation enzyme)